MAVTRRAPCSFQVKLFAWSCCQNCRIYLVSVLYQSLPKNCCLDQYVYRLDQYVYPNTEHTLYNTHIISCNARPSYGAIRLYNMIEDQLKWFTGQFPDTVVPRELLRDHLTPDVNPQLLDQQSSYLGNRMAACQDAQQSLVFTCCGLAGHKMAMSVLDRHSAPMQVLQATHVTVAFYSQHTLQQCKSPVHAVIDPRRPMFASHCFLYFLFFPFH